MLKKFTTKINSLLFSFKIFLITFETQKSIARMYSRMCELDLEEFMLVDDETSMLAGGSTVDIIQDGYRFNLNQCDEGIVCHIHFKVTNQWLEIYRTNTHIGAYKWVTILSQVNKQLIQQKIYQKQQAKNLAKSENGIM